MSMVSWFYRFRGVNDFVVSYVSCGRFHALGGHPNRFAPLY